MRLTFSTILVVLILLSLNSCKKESVCNEGLVKYVLVDVQYASIVSFNFSSDSTINLGGVTSDVKLTPADATDGIIYSTGDVNLNGYKLTLDNVVLIVRGNLNGGGAVVTRGANGAICVNGATQNNPDLSKANVSCPTLSDDSVDSFTEIGTECDLGSTKYVNGDRFEAVEFIAL